MQILIQTPLFGARETWLGRVIRYSQGHYFIGRPEADTWVVVSCQLTLASDRLTFTEIGGFPFLPIGPNRQLWEGCQNQCVWQVERVLLIMKARRGIYGGGIRGERGP